MQGGEILDLACQHRGTKEAVIGPGKVRCPGTFSSVLSCRIKPSEVNVFNQTMIVKIQAYASLSRLFNISPVL